MSAVGRVDFSSLLLIALTKATIPAGLDQVTVRITNAGVQEETVYEAQPNLSHVYAWNGTNAYKQVVYGFSSAKGILFHNNSTGYPEKSLLMTFQNLFQSKNIL